MTLVLRLGNQEFSDWKRFEASRSVSDATAQFSLEVTESASVPPAFVARKLRSGAEIEMVLDGIVAITGKVDDVSRSFDKEDHRVSLRGRGAMRDAIDASVILPDGGQLRNRTLDQVLAAVLDPFGLALEFVGDPGPPFPSVVPQLGETAWEMIERLSRMRGFWVHETATGVVRADRGVRPGIAGALIEGENILIGSSTDRSQARHSEIVVKAQRPGGDRVAGIETSEIEARVPDVNVGAYRPLVIVAEEPLDRAGARFRADWEATVRAAESLEAEIVVVGWTRPDGALWDAGDLLDVVSPTLALDRDMAVRDVRWSLDDNGGHLTTLSLVPPEALDATKPAPAPQPAAAAEEKTTHRRGRAVPGVASEGFDVDPIWTETKPTELAK